MSVETRLWLIRHAPVIGLKGTIHGPDAHADVSDERTLQSLKARLPTEARAFTSPAQRTLLTSKALGIESTVQPAFREQNFGSWTGRLHNDLAVEFGDSYRQFWNAPATNAPPLGESFADQIIRTNAGLTELPPGDVILLVHSGTIRAMLAIALSLTAEAALRFVIDPLSLTRIDRIDDAWRVNEVNWKY